MRLQNDCLWGKERSVCARVRVSLCVNVLYLSKSTLWYSSSALQKYLCWLFKEAAFAAHVPCLCHSYFLLKQRDQQVITGFTIIMYKMTSWTLQDGYLSLVNNQKISRSPWVIDKLYLMVCGGCPILSDQPSFLWQEFGEIWIWSCRLSWSSINIWAWCDCQQLLTMKVNG